MRDPVTTVTGITYDRESIELWLVAAAADATTAMCPVTKQPLPPGSDLTPNHMLRRLIQGWCIANAKNGIDRIPTPKFPVHRSLVMKLIREVNSSRIDDNVLRGNALKKMEEIANESEANKKCMAEAGVAKAMIKFVLRSCSKEGKNLIFDLEKALRILQLVWDPSSENKEIVENNMDLIQSLFWIVKTRETENAVKTQALLVMKIVMEIASSTLMERLSPDFFVELVNVVRRKVSSQATKAALNVLIKTCPFGRNKISIIETGAVYDLIEIEWSNPEKKISELVFCLLANLCCCADGRQEFLKHAGAIAVVGKRLLRVSGAADDFLLSIIESIARFTATNDVLMEMLRVGAVSKLCMVIQADCADYLKKRARETLRLHSYAWSNSPCIQVYLLTRFNR